MGDADSTENESLDYEKQNSRKIVWIVFFTFVVFVTWANFALLEEIVRGDGQVVPAVKNQLVQNLEGGIVEKIYVTEGDIIESGSLIAKMDATKFQSAYQEYQEQRLALLLRLARLRAERELSLEFVPNESLVNQAPEYAKSERQLFSARRADLISKKSNLEKLVNLQSREVEMLRPMAEQAAVPEIELVRAEQALVETRSTLDAALKEFEASRSQEYSETLVQLRQIEEQLRSRKDQLIRTDVRSPVRGIVNKVFVTTIGGVVNPGEPLAEVLPLGENLRVQGRISPRDIGFVFSGMAATVKLTAFDFSVYGTLNGTVSHVGADTVVDENDSQNMPYYEVYIDLENTELEGPAGKVEIRPGMQAFVELKAGKKTVLKYLIKPFSKASEALTER